VAVAYWLSCCGGGWRYGVAIMYSSHGHKPAPGVAAAMARYSSINSHHRIAAFRRMAAAAAAAAPRRAAPRAARAAAAAAARRAAARRRRARALCYYYKAKVPGSHGR
jgi:hypothetical protein